MSGRRRRSQKAGMLAELQRRGPLGLRSIDLVAGHVDARPILNYAARIDELRRAGHRIETRREPDGTARYVLHPPEQRVTVPEPAAAPSAPGELLPAAPQSAVLGWEDAR